MYAAPAPPNLNRNLSNSPPPLVLFAETVASWGAMTPLPSFCREVGERSVSRRGRYNG